MSDDRKKPLWPWIVALLIGLPVLYVASFGPACWICQSGEDHREVGHHSLSADYLAVEKRPATVGDSVVWYASLGATADRGWTQHIDRSEMAHELE